MALRIIAVVALLFSVLFCPFFVSAALGALSIIYFSKYYEGAAVFFISDLLFGSSVGRFSGIYFVSGISALLLLFIVEFLKKKMRISKQVKI